jgi:2-dehydro-3-deoxygluconokinase
VLIGGRNCTRSQGGEGLARTALGGIAAVRASLDQLLGACDVLLAGLDEAASLLGTDDPETLRRIARDRGIREVVLKDGAEGSWVPDGRAMTHLPALPTETVDAVGAGDAYAGTYLAARLAGKSPVEAGRLATKVAAGVVATPGDIEGLPPPDVARAWLHG